MPSDCPSAQFWGTSSMVASAGPGCVSLPALDEDGAWGAGAPTGGVLDEAPPQEAAAQQRAVKTQRAWGLLEHAHA
jgi:hypothetical protein